MIQLNSTLFASQKVATNPEDVQKAPFISKDLHSMLLSASTQLESFSRGIVPILGDGNCLFRAHSKLTYGDEEWHSFMRALLVEFVSLNQEVFRSYCIVNITDYLSKMKHERTWGTHVELQAAASLLKLPIYVFTQKSGSGEYYWEVFKPIRDAQTVLKLPESAIQKPLGVHHYEICHTMRCHYDIITLSDGFRPIEPPHIEPQHSYLEI